MLMGGYQISYEAFKTYVQKQALMAKRECEKAEGMENYTTQAASYIGSAEAREYAVFELAKYLGAPEKEVKKIWEDAEK
jgi:hypothetical protein